MSQRISLFTFQLFTSQLRAAPRPPLTLKYFLITLSISALIFVWAFFFFFFFLISRELRVGSYESQEL